MERPVSSSSWSKQPRLGRASFRHSVLGTSATAGRASGVWPRGLLRNKGVGLCHGISGNAFAILALEQTKRSFHQSDSGANPRGSSSPSFSSKRDMRARSFASFSLQHYEELESIPDLPHSLYEGAAGLACLLLDLSFA